MPPSTPGRALLGVLVLGAVVAAGLVVSPSATVGALESVADDPVAFGLVVAGLYLLRPLFAWPTTPLAVVVGYGLGVTIGLPVAMAGVLLTVIPTYLAARWVLDGAHDEALAALPFDGFVRRTGRAVRRYYETAGPTRGVVVSRLAPIPSDAATCAAAASGVTLRQLLVGTAIGELPWTVAAVVVGASAATITADGLGELGPPLTLACLFAAALLLSGPTYRLVARSDDRRWSPGN
ncbi:TVP38/TMEM64 family protein [Halovivax sp.]|uniref:TVP38/TMEM64 family protein n=1 Tax=Halovivax sp. TaxID=1935978 RepID=UPI0025BD7930|nr:VTT domain-containing protein [Halovivax sp.]